ncbi:GntR family transcriptional regulator [Paenibacillus koleovorans]|uniref:GntR family transcriptional regulator n=1 Tax=Paenibacillus koleovorans TaxID=121608 RepID=UPI000FDA6085|nr:GntR family transcriptional regulator [Paenibacillus koleovorans]
MIQLNERSMMPIYEQIVQQLKESIAKGILQEGDKLPSVRELSAQLLVNPNTVAKSFQELERQGVIATLRGKGTFVAKPAASPGMERERTEHLQEELRAVIVEARHLGISREQFAAWTDEEWKRFGGDES